MGNHLIDTKVSPQFRRGVQLLRGKIRRDTTVIRRVTNVGIRVRRARSHKRIAEEETSAPIAAAGTEGVSSG